MAYNTKYGKITLTAIWSGDDGKAMCEMYSEFDDEYFGLISVDSSGVTTVEIEKQIDEHRKNYRKYVPSDLIFSGMFF